MHGVGFAGINGMQLHRFDSKNVTTQDVKENGQYVPVLSYVRDQRKN